MEAGAAHADPGPAGGARRGEPRSSRTTSDALAGSRPGSRTPPPTASASSSARARRRSPIPPPTSPSGRSGPSRQVTAVLEKLCRRKRPHPPRGARPRQDGGSTRYELFHDVLGEPSSPGAATTSGTQPASRPSALRAHRRRAPRTRRRPRRAERSGRCCSAATGSGNEEGDRPPQSPLDPSQQSEPAQLDVALLLGLEAYGHPSAQVGSSMMSTLAGGSALRYGGDLAQHRVPSTTSPSARTDETLASAGDDGTVRLWGGRAAHPARYAEPLHGDDPSTSSPSARTAIRSRPPAKTGPCCSGTRAHREARPTPERQPAADGRFQPGRADARDSRLRRNSAALGTSAPPLPGLL